MVSHDLEGSQAGDEHPNEDGWRRPATVSRRLRLCAVQELVWFPALDRSGRGCRVM